MEVHDPLVLADDVMVIPVTSLKDEVRRQLDCDDDDFAISRPRSRTPSTIVDAQAAGLLERFRQPRTLVEAVILFSRERGLEPEGVLDAAYPLVSRFLSSRVLVSANEAGNDDAPRPDLEIGNQIAGFRVVRPIQAFEDTHVYEVRDAAGRRGALKIQRPGPGAVGSLEHERGILEHLEGIVAPALLDAGEHHGRQYLMLEWCAGVDSTAAAAEWRGARPGARRHLAELCHRIAAAYTELHARNVLHADVHPRNVIVGRDGGVRLVDFGLAVRTDEGAAAPLGMRGGVAFYFEPEYAAAQLGMARQAWASPAGEQYALGALLYNVMTGAHYLDFSLERDKMLHQILEQQPLPFAERGRAPWPEMEATLARALEKDPAGRFGSMATLADALDAICADAATDPAAALGKGQRDAGGEGVRLAGAGRRPAGELPAGLQTVLDRHLRNVALEGPLFVSGIAGTPTASVVFGASGIAAALYRIASQRDDHELLALADAWSCRAVKLAAGDDAFYSERLEITPDRVGEASVYHSPTGVFAVQALIARRMGDEVSQGAAIEAFLGAAARPMVGIDLNLGHCGALLAGAMLLETLPADESPLRAALIGWGNRTLQHVWEGLDAQAAIPEAEIDNLGIAHGWAGFLYASLHWCAGAGADMPAGAEQRLDQLAELAEPVGRGLRWPWRVTADPRQTIYMPGWCNGSAGYVFTWTLAHRLFGAQRYRQLAEGAAWDAWDSTESYGTLCCGLVGRAYALLNIHRHTGERDWLYRAIELGRRAADSGQFQPDLAHSLYKGELALAVLAADLQQPDAAVQPLFEPEGWPTRAA